jgi:hypothetical protein
MKSVTLEGIAHITLRKLELVRMHKGQERLAEKRVDMVTDVLREEGIDKEKRKVAGKDRPICGKPMSI